MLCIFDVSTRAGIEACLMTLFYRLKSQQSATIRYSWRTLGLLPTTVLTAHVNISNQSL
jgi:hypothetical protein